MFWYCRKWFNGQHCPSHNFKDHELENFIRLWNWIGVFMLHICIEWIGRCFWKDFNSKNANSSIESPSYTFHVWFGCFFFPLGFFLAFISCCNALTAWFIQPSSTHLFFSLIPSFSPFTSSSFFPWSLSWQFCFALGIFLIVSSFLVLFLHDKSMCSSS